MIMTLKIIVARYLHTTAGQKTAINYLMNLIAEIHGHKDRIQKNDAHDMLSCADYKLRPELLSVIRAYLTCFALELFSMPESTVSMLNFAHKPSLLTLESLGTLVGAGILAGPLVETLTEKFLRSKSACVGASVMKFHVDMSRMKNLEYLDLSSNKLSSLPSNTISQLNDKKTLTIDIGDNNLICTCDTMGFLKWVLHSHLTNIQFSNGNGYTCTDRHSKQVALHELSLFALIVGCYIPYLLYVVIVILIAVGIVYAFKRRYQLRHLWYKIRKRCQHKDYNQQQHKYDAFVCFHRDDSSWIESEVKERLKHFKIVYGEEEVEFGQSLPNVISQYIKESRRSILTLSPAFVDSQNNSITKYYANLIRENLMHGQ